MTSTLSNYPVRVNVRLCGSVPREELDRLSLGGAASSAPLSPRTCSFEEDVHMMEHSSSSISSADMASQLCSQLAPLTMHSEQQHQQQLLEQQQRRASQPPPMFAPPSWAVPACGESRLEPVCESLHTQHAVDLTERSVFYIGRSPANDVQLLHATSSRRHALLFHHANGSCYIVDCGSAHGTFVNGVRVESAPRSGGSVIPTKLRKGAIVRFGGPGAPSFMLKSFEFELDELSNHHNNSSSSSLESLMNMDISSSTLPSTPDMHEVVQLNTRLNSLGQTAKDSLKNIMMYGGNLSSKRSFDSIETVQTASDNNSKRCSSPLLEQQQQPLRLVSPENSASPTKRRRVSFSSEPPLAVYPQLVSPDLSGDEE